MQSVLENYLNSVCCSSPIVSYNFDLEMDWSILLDMNNNPYPVTNQASFELWLTDGFDSALESQNDFTNIVITDFKKTGNRIQCNLTATCTTFSLGNNTIVNANKLGTLNGLIYLWLNYNDIVDFNPSVALPNTLNTLSLGNNSLASFNPTISLPVSLQNLFLNDNPFTLAGYTASEPWANSQPSFTSLCTIDFQGNVSTSGTNLRTILLTKNCTITP
jgi:hypothetical protein